MLWVRVRVDTVALSMSALGDRLVAAQGVQAPLLCSTCAAKLEGANPMDLPPNNSP